MLGSYSLCLLGFFFLGVQESYMTQNIWKAVTGLIPLCLWQISSLFNPASLQVSGSAPSIPSYGVLTRPRACSSAVHSHNQVRSPHILEHCPGRGCSSSLLTKQLLQILPRPPQSHCVSVMLVLPKW